MKLLVLVAIAGMAWGQQRSQAPVEPRALKAYLGLTDEQLMQLTAARQQAHLAADERAKALQPQMEQKYRAVQALMNNPNADPAALGKALLEVKAMERQMHEAQASAQNVGLSVLTQEQRAKFKLIQDAALLPQATREAIGMGLVPGTPGAPTRRQQFVSQQFRNQQRREENGGPQGPQARRPMPPQPQQPE